MTDELKDLIDAKLDVTQLMDLLNLEFRELLDYLDPLLDEYEFQLQSACR